jgi:Predicted Zn-dependent peptidases
MLKRYFLNNKKRNFSTASIWIKGGSDLDSVGKKGINKILSSLLTRGCEGFNNYTLSEYIESYGAELNQEVFEDGISISIKSLNEHFSKLFPLLDLIVNKPNLLEIEFQKVKKSSIDFIKKDKENPFNICFEKWRRIVYSNHPYAFNTNGNLNDVSKITYEDILLEFQNFKNRDKYLISNNLEINGLSIETLKKNTLEVRPRPINHDLSPNNRFDFNNNDSNQTIIMFGNQTCSRGSFDYLPLKVLESYLSLWE